MKWYWIALFMGLIAASVLVSSEVRVSFQQRGFVQKLTTWLDVGIGTLPVIALITLIATTVM